MISSLRRNTIKHVLGVYECHMRKKHNYFLKLYSIEIAKNAILWHLKTQFSIILQMII